MTLAITGLGLISPAGATARDHVFFPRAEGPPPAPSPFLGADGARIDAACCPFLASDFAGIGRMLELARAAIEEATTSLPSKAAGTPLFLVTPAPRPGLASEQIAALGRALGALIRAPSVTLFTGAAGAFVALAQIREAIDAGQLGHALLVGVDSLLDVDTLTERVLHPPSPFLLAPPPPAEGAAALLLTAPSEATRLGVRVVGEVLDSRHAMGRGTDEDDEPVDGVAMTELLRALPLAGTIRSAFGQRTTDLLRLRDWHFVTARCADRFDHLCFAPCLEAEIGALGAAAGVANLAFAFALFRHGATPLEAEGPLVVWSIARDGTRGLALGSTARADASALVPLVSTAHARSVELAPLPAPPPASELDEEDLDRAGLEPLGPAANDVSPLLPSLPGTIVRAAPVALDLERRPALTIAAFHASMVQHAAELAAALGRARFDGPRRELARTEARLLRQLDAIVAAGNAALASVATFWSARADDPFAAFAAALAAASFAGDAAIHVIADAIHALPPEPDDHLVTLGEALALADHPGLLPLAHDLSVSAHPLARALGVSVRGARGDLPFDAVYAALTDASALVVRAGIWAAERLPAAQRGLFVQLLRSRSESPLPGVAWSATRVLAAWGDRAVLVDALDGPLGARLGPRAAELFVLTASPADWPLFEALLGRHRTTRALVSAVARFGAPASIAWLIPRLDDDALGDAVSSALETLLGPLVAPASAREAAAWRKALATQTFDPRQRLRRGHPWSPALVAEECASGDLSRLELALRIDELRARCNAPDPLDLGAWAPDAEARVSDFLGKLPR